ncbi:hypothetical protein FRX31_023617 [Thalictrum thalictroides]|uniref:Uncharacterized protein n=1 Tax=Thalictrum thalictroides TaxID=46969 RepID=A0A7J6VNW3_THATH|nr:hypothetical protein FRX31_023617 [Thalictrum thalictroides]
MTDSSSQQGCDQVVINIEDMLRTAPYLRPSRDCCIHKVPVHLRNINEAAYTPQIISIGPLHRDDKKLKPMQAYKVHFLNTLLRRKPSIKLEDYVKTLRGLEKKVRNCYFNQEFVCSISSNDFVQMMLLDGCFIVELLITKCCPTNTELLPWPRPYNKKVKFDLMLYENQLPYFLLEDLFNFINGNNQICQVSFFDLVDGYFRDYYLNDAHRLKNSGHQVKHFLGLILNCHRPLGLTLSVEDDNTDRKPIYLPSATELHESGVKFKKGKSHCYLDIKSNKNGVLEIPLLVVEDSTEQRFRNMIAMEQWQDDNTAYITHYMFLLDFLINTPNS